MSHNNSVERTLERLIFASRWILAPMYLGLVLALGMLMVVFLRELFLYAMAVMTMKSEEVILVVLTLIDLTLAANLLLIVLFSGYENFVSKLDIDPGMERPAWMGTVDFSGLKMKLIASIVAISAIDLLKWYMSIEESVGLDASDGQLFWLVVIHMAFVVSGVLLALMDWLVSKSAKH